MRRSATRGFTLIEMTIVTAVALAGLTLTIAAIQVASRAVAITANAELPTDEEKARTRQLLEHDLRDLDPFTAYVAAGGVATGTINVRAVPRWTESALPLPHKADPAVTYHVENANLLRRVGDRREVVMRNIGSIASQANLCARTVRLTFNTADDDPTRALSVQLPLTGRMRLPARLDDLNQPSNWQHRYTRWNHQLALDATCADRLEEVGTLLRLTNPNVPKVAPNPALHENGGTPAAVFQTAHGCLRIDKENRTVFYCLEPPLGATPTTQANRVVRYERRYIPQLDPQNRFIPTYDGLRFWCGAINPTAPTGDPGISNYAVFFDDPTFESTTPVDVRNACWQLMNARENGTEVTTRTVMDDPDDIQGTVTDITGVRALGSGLLLVYVLTAEGSAVIPSPNLGSVTNGPAQDGFAGIGTGDGSFVNPPPFDTTVPLFVPVMPNAMFDAQSVDLMDALNPLHTQLRTRDSHCEVPVTLREPSNQREAGRRTFTQDKVESIWLHGIDCRD